LRRRHLEHPLDARAEVVQRLDAEGHARAPLGAELVDQERQRAALDVAEQERRAAGLGHAVGDLGDLEVGVDLGRHLVQLALTAQMVEPVAEIGERHRAGVYAGAVATGAVLSGLAGGFVTHDLPIAGACALLGAGAVGILAWQAVGRLAQEQQYADWVARRGWQPARNLPAALVTSLLRAGDTRRLEDGFEGEIEGRRAGIGHFIWETVERSVDEYGNVHETRIPHTDTVLETLTGLQSMTRLTLLPRHHGQGRLADGLASA